MFTFKVEHKLSRRYIKRLLKVKELLYISIPLVWWQNSCLHQELVGSFPRRHLPKWDGEFLLSSFSTCIMGKIRDSAVVLKTKLFHLRNFFFPPSLSLVIKTVFLSNVVWHLFFRHVAVRDFFFLLNPGSLRPLHGVASPGEGCQPAGACGRLLSTLAAQTC